MQLPNHLPHPPRWIVAHTLVPACTTVLLWVSSPYQVTLAKAVAAFLLACHLRAFGPRKFMKVQSVTPLFSATGPWLSTLDAVDFLLPLEGWRRAPVHLYLGYVLERLRLAAVLG